MALAREAEDGLGPAVSSEAGRDKGGMQGGGGRVRRCGVAAAAWSGRALLVLSPCEPEILTTCWWLGVGGGAGMGEKFK